MSTRRLLGAIRSPRESAPAYSPAVDGIYDLGGVAGFGTIGIEIDEPTFHEATTNGF